MKLSNRTVKLIIDSTNLACVLGIEGLIYDKDGIRGYNTTEGVILVAMEDFNFEFENLGLSRLQSLKNKFLLLKDLNTIDVEAVSKKNNNDITEQLKFNCGKIDFGFRCALTRNISDVPTKTFNRQPIFYFDIDEDDISHITQGITSMRCTNMTIQGNSEGVRFRFSDDTGDILNYNLDSELGLGSDQTEMSLTLNIKKALPILRIAGQMGKFTLNILKNNIVYVTVNQFDIFVISEV